ncbi:MAG TPA: LysR family transcriptional regulator [Clostridia bacterium]|nr:LysR family transcriptional regulator [Clostridia bacterium]HPQ47420.1 LysR family transcriptional regulator [Clostridia bacterium]
MNLESLKFFFEVVKAGSITNVAKSGHISQSALSQQLTRLETELNEKLLIRSNKGVSLTRAGEVVYKFSENIIRTYDEMLYELDSLKKSESLIKVAACRSIADYAIPCTLVLANREFPDHKYELFSRNSADIASDVANNIFDIGFSYITEVNKASSEVVSIKTGANNIILVGKNVPSNPDTMSPEQLLDACVITFTGKNEIDDILKKNFKKLGYDNSNLNCHMEVEGIEGAKMMISRNYGIAFLPYIAVKEELYKKEFKEITVPGFDLNLDMLLMFKKNHSTHVEEFISWFLKNGSRSFC